MIPRILEPEVMDSLGEAVEYDSMDHSEVNRRFVSEFLGFATRTSDQMPDEILDVGTGTAQIPIELCRQNPTCKITAVDLSREMLKIGEQNAKSAGCSDRISLEYRDAKNLPHAEGQFHAVISNSIIHHIPEPAFVFAEMKRVLAMGGVLFVRDLLRPDDAATLNQIVETYAGQENAHQQKMFRESLHAALTLEEVRDMLTAQNMPNEWAMQTSDRHWTIAGQMV